MNGYLILIVNGNNPAYRIIFKPSLHEALKAIKQVKAESGGRAEILRMIDGDTKREVEYDDTEI